MKMKFFRVLFTIILIFSVTVSTSGSYCRNVIVEMETEAFVRINNIRAENGLDKLTWSNDLYVSAVIRCREGAILFEHVRPDGSPCWTAFVNQYGYSGENMAHGQTSPAQVVRDWMNSDTHRALILDAGFVSAAVSCRYFNGAYYWIEHFSSNYCPCV